MSRDEFIGGLQEALADRVPEAVISENVNYYRRYIDEQVRAGKTEADVLNMLGDPRLLAKTIEGSSQFAGGQGQGAFSNMGGTGAYSAGGYSSGSYSSGGYSSGGYADGAYSNDDFDEKRFKIPGWLIACIVILAVMFIVMIVFRAFVFFLPVIIAVALISAAIRLLQKWFKF